MIFMIPHQLSHGVMRSPSYGIVGHEILVKSHEYVIERNLYCHHVDRSSIRISNILEGNPSNQPSRLIIYMAETCSE